VDIEVPPIEVYDLTASSNGSSLIGGTDKVGCVRCGRRPLSPALRILRLGMQMGPLTHLLWLLNPPPTSPATRLEPSSVVHFSVCDEVQCVTKDQVEFD